MRDIQDGFSTIELLVVIVIIAIMSVFAIIGFNMPKKYGPDNQVMKLADVLQDARQRALVEKAIMRVEINKTKKEIYLIDENVAGNAGDDKMVRTFPLDSTEVLIDAPPSNVPSTNVPTADFPIPEATYSTSKHPLSLNDQVMVFRFKPDGQVVNAGTDSIGTGSIVKGATVYVYEKPNAAGYSNIVRAITLIGFTGASRIVKCQMDAQNKCAVWAK